jgi:hypothetical protein
VREDDDLSRHFPKEHRVRVRIRLQEGGADGRDGLEGSRTRPAGWGMVSESFGASEPRTGEMLARP